MVNAGGRGHYGVKLCQLMGRILNEKVFFWSLAIREGMIICQTFEFDTYMCHPHSCVFHRCSVEAIRGHFLTDENVRALIIGTN